MLTHNFRYYLSICSDLWDPLLTRRFKVQNYSRKLKAINDYAWIKKKKMFVVTKQWK